MPAWPRRTCLTGVHRPHPHELGEEGWQEEDQRSWTSGKPRTRDCPRTSDHCAKITRLGAKEDGLLAQPRGCQGMFWASATGPDVPGRVLCESHREAGAGSLSRDPAPRLLQAHLHPYHPILARLRESPMARLPLWASRCSQEPWLIKSPALMSGARKRAANFSQDGQEDTPRKSSVPPPDLLVWTWASLITCLVERVPARLQLCLGP